MKKILLLFASLIVCLGLSAEKTTRRGLVVDRAAVEPTPVEVLYDTISPTDDAVVRSGYDKPLRSTLETFFLTNNTGRELHSICLLFVYSDLSGRKLHEEERWITCMLPAGETRAFSVRSWDRQRSFYYRRSTPPKRASGTPYDVATRLKAIVHPHD